MVYKNVLMKVDRSGMSQLSFQKPMGRPAKFPRIKQQIRSAIIQGRFKPNEQLPSVDKLAKQLGVGGPTAKKAIDELASEGWLESLHGVGTFVRMRKDTSQVMLTAPRRYGWEPFLSVENLDAFHAKHPHVRIILSSEPTTDIAVTDSYTLVVDRLRGQTLQSLENLRKQFGREAWALPEKMRAMGTYEGVLYGLPMRADLLLLQTNPQLLESVGVKPIDRYMSWEQRKDILTSCRLDRNGDGVYECFGAFSKLALYEWLIPFWQRGGRLDDRKAFFRSEPFQVLSEIWEMHHKSGMLPIEMPPGQSETANGVIRRRFVAQQVAMRWITNLDIFDQLPFATSIALPRFGSVARQEMHAMLLGVHRDCSHPDVAMEFLDFCYRRFIRDNAEYPFALSDEHRQQLRQAPSVHRLLQDGFSDASEPLHEGSPPRTWAIESEIYNCFRLLQQPDQMERRLHKLWGQEAGGSVAGSISPMSLGLPWSEIVSPVGQLFQ